MITSCLFFEIISENNSNFFFNGGILGEGLGNYHNYFLNDFDYKTYTLWIIVFTNIFLFLFSFNINIAKIKTLFFIVSRVFGNIFIFIAYGLRFSKELNLKESLKKIFPKKQ